MDHISQALSKIQEQQTLETSSKPQKQITNLLPEEKTILEIKYASSPFGKMSMPELLVAANMILIKIHAITGWALPEPEVAKILKDQFIKKMQESYPTVNVDEIEYAFRTYGTTVKDWGKSMNLSLIDEVMIPYLDARFELSKREEQIKTKPIMIENKENLSDVAMGDWFQDVRKKVIDGMDYALIPAMIYDWLDGQGKIVLDVKTKYAYMDKAAQKIEAQGEPPLVEKVKNLAKKMIVNDYILKNG